MTEEKQSPYSQSVVCVSDRVVQLWGNVGQLMILRMRLFAMSGPIFNGHNKFI